MGSIPLVKVMYRFFATDASLSEWQLHWNLFSCSGQAFRNAGVLYVSSGTQCLGTTHQSCTQPEHTLQKNLCPPVPGNGTEWLLSFNLNSAIFYNTLSNTYKCHLYI